MPKKQRKFVDDGWAVWVDGDDTSTVYLNDWINPKGKNYIDVSVRIRGMKDSSALYVYVPFAVDHDEIQDVSLSFDNRRILQAIFNSTCIVDYKKNEYTSEMAYNGKTIDILHISAVGYEAKPLSKGTLITIDFKEIQPFIDNDEAYIIWRMPHKTLDNVFKVRVDVGSAMNRFWGLVTSPIVSEKYSYSVRINEARLLPEEITRISEFRRQKLKKAVILISIDEEYELNDAGCYRIRRLEEELYRDFLPEKYDPEGVITYQWNQNHDYDLRGRFNFYNSISRNIVSHGSIILYVILFIIIGVAGIYIDRAIIYLLDLLF